MKNNQVQKGKKKIVTLLVALLYLSTPVVTALAQTNLLPRPSEYLAMSSEEESATDEDVSIETIDGEMELGTKETVSLDANSQKKLRVLLPDVPLEDFNSFADVPFLEAFGDEEGVGILEDTERTFINNYVEFKTKNKDDRIYSMYFGRAGSNGKFHYKDDGTIDRPADITADPNLPGPNEGETSLDLRKELPTDDKVPKNYIWGHVDGTTTWDGLANKGEDIVPLTFPNILLSVPSTHNNNPANRIASYAYLSGAANPLETGFALAQTDTHGSETIKATTDDKVIYKSASSLETFVPIGRLYKRETSEAENAKKETLIGYGMVLRTIKDGDYRPQDATYEVIGYMRVEMTPQKNNGRVRTNVAFVNASADENRSVTALGYGLHISIENQHRKSKLYSLGNDLGEYFDQEEISDGNPYFLVFHRDGYADQPISRIADNNYNGNIIMSKNKNSFNPGFVPALDPGEEVQFDLGSAPHPALAYMWEKKATGIGEVVDWNFDQSVRTALKARVITQHFLEGTETALADPVTATYEEEEGYTTSPVEIDGYEVVDKEPEGWQGIMDVEDIVVTYYYRLETGDVQPYYKDEKGNDILTEDPINGNVGDPFEIKPKEIEGYTYLKSEGKTSGEFTKEPQEVTFVYRKNAEVYSLLQEVLNADGVSVDGGTARPKDELTYRLSLSVDPDVNDLGYKYQEMMLNTKVDDNLENVSDMTLKDEDGTVIGTAKLENGTVIGELTSTDLAVTKKLVLSYKAKIKEDAKVDDLIKAKGTATGKLKLGSLNSSIKDFEANEVVTTVIPGSLEFVSAPKTVSFGEDLKLSTEEKVYKVETIEGNQLVIQDNRVLGQGWEMSVKLLDDLVSSDNHKLTEALYYANDIDDKPITTVPRLVKKMTSTTNDEVVLSKDWGPDKGLRLKVLPGLAKATSYTGELQWTLRDVPANENE